MDSLAKRKQALLIKAITGASSIAIAVALPQLLHIIGGVSGLGSALGETFLPMHLSVFVAGFLAGPVVGIVAGILSPILSFLLTGMPAVALLPFMVIELAMYGLFSGVLKNVKIPTIAKLLIAQIAGRAIRAIAILVAFYGFNSTKIPTSIIFSSIAVGLPGILLQWALIPLLMYRMKGLSKYYE